MLVDTLTTRLNNVVYHEPNLEVCAPSVEARTGEIAPSLEICGYSASKAYLNTPRLQFTCKAKRLPTGETVSIETVKFSVPKVLERDEPGVNLNANDIRAALAAVGEELAENGIYAEPLESSLWRVDTTADIQTNEPFLAYSPIFESMHCHHFSDAKLGTTFRLGGKEKQFCIYDKIAEYKMRGEDTSRMPANVARFEYRMLKAHACRSAGFSNVAALLENYEQLRAQTLEAWNHVLERKELGKSAEAVSAFMQLAKRNEAENRITTHSDAMREVGHTRTQNSEARHSATQNSEAEHNGTKWIANAERALGLRYLLENGVTPSAYYQQLLELGASRKAASAHRKDMTAVQLAADNINLYDELKVKLNDAFT